MARVEVRSEIAGAVWKIKVAVGQSVQEGEVLIDIESMKMEIPIFAEVSGTVTEICVTENAPVSEGQVVVVVES